MSKYILTAFNKHLPLEINSLTVKTMLMLMYSFESRQKHPQALNSPMLGVYPMYFTTQDQNNLFDIFDLDVATVKKAIRECPSINTTFNVTSDPYNLLTMWALHNTVNSTLTSEEQYHMCMALAKMLHYKFFTSFVNRSYKYGADENVMKAVVDSLTKKFDITEYGTWKATIEARCEDFLDRNSIHYKTLQTFNDDKKILYMLSDTQTRIRNKIKNINELYYEYKAKGDAISTSSLNSEIDGEKIMKDIVSTSDTMVSNISNEVLNINEWIDNRYIKLISGMFQNVTQDLFRRVLVSFANTAALQAKSGKLDYIKKDGDKIDYIGCRVLISAILQKTYTACKRSRTNMRSKNDILIKVRNLYSASRISDQGIIDIKDAVNNSIVNSVNITREATIASLRIAFISYIMLKSFEYL